MPEGRGANYGLTARRWLALVVAALAIGVAGCEQRAAPGAARAPDVAYDPTPHHVVAEMLKLGRVGDGDVVYDLGCGDGRIVIAAAKLGARGVCVDIDPQRIRESRANAERAGVTERIQFLNQDLFETDIAEATVVTLFLWPSVNEKLRPKLWRELRPGTRVVSYIHSMGDWRPQEAVNVESLRGPRKVFLWIIPQGGLPSARGRAVEALKRHGLERQTQALAVEFHPQAPTTGHGNPGRAAPGSGPLRDQNDALFPHAHVEHAQHRGGRSARRERPPFAVPHGHGDADGAVGTRDSLCGERPGPCRAGDALLGRHRHPGCGLGGRRGRPDDRPKENADDGQHRQQNPNRYPASSHGVRRDGTPTSPARSS